MTTHLRCHICTILPRAHRKPPQRIAERICDIARDEFAVKEPSPIQVLNIRVTYYDGGIYIYMFCVCAYVYSCVFVQSLFIHRNSGTSSTWSLLSVLSGFHMSVSTLSSSCITTVCCESHLPQAADPRPAISDTYAAFLCFLSYLFTFLCVFLLLNVFCSLSLKNIKPCSIYTPLTRTHRFMQIYLCIHIWTSTLPCTEQLDDGTALVDGFTQFRCKLFEVNRSGLRSVTRDPHIDTHPNCPANPAATSNRPFTLIVPLAS